MTATTSFDTTAKRDSTLAALTNALNARHYETAAKHLLNLVDLCKDDKAIVEPVTHALKFMAHTGDSQDACVLAMRVALRTKKQDGKELRDAALKIGNWLATQKTIPHQSMGHNNNRVVTTTPEEFVRTFTPDMRLKSSPVYR